MPPKIFPAKTSSQPSSIELDISSRISGEVLQEGLDPTVTFFLAFLPILFLEYSHDAWRFSSHIVTMRIKHKAQE